MANRQHTAVAASNQSGVSKNVYILTIAIVLIVGFVAGTRSNELIGAIGPLIGIKVETSSLDLAGIQNTYRQLKTNYDGSVDSKKLVEGASRGLVASVGDPYTAFLDAKEAKAFDEDLTGQIGGGVGAEIGVRGGQPTIIRLIPDNPAEKAGLKAGDVILSVNDQATRDWPADKTAMQIRGEVGTTVKLVVQRNEETKEFVITRAAVTNPSVESKIDNGIGILTISRFDGETGDLGRRAAESLKAQGIRGIILDLRGNGGGYITAAQDIASLWLNDRVVVTERTGGKVTDELRSAANPILAGMPTVVLVDGTSASASEIVAGALQDYKAAVLVGEKTFGKGTVQKLIDLGAGTKLKVTVARWYTPHGKNISGGGIPPDQKVGLSIDDVNAGRDPQLDAAKTRLP